MKKTILTLNDRKISVYYDLEEQESDRPMVQEKRVFHTRKNTVCALLCPANTPYFWLCPSFHRSAAEHSAFVMRDVAQEAQRLLNAGRSVQAVLVGAPASLLRLALTGRASDTSPDSASLEQARIGRRQIKVLADNDAAYILAQVAVEEFGACIQPWLGVTKLDESGHIVGDDPCYKVRIPLD